MDSFSGSLPITFLTDTFPIIGLRSDEQLQSMIQAERRVSAKDLWETVVLVSVVYDNPFPWNDQGPLTNRSLHLTQITVRRENTSLIFEAHAETLEQLEGNLHTTVLETSVLASTSISISPLLGTLRDYVSHKSQAAGAIAAFNEIGNIIGQRRQDELTESLHFDLSKTILDNLDRGPIKIGATPADIALRYLSTAIMMHILPANVFNDIAFLKDYVRPKYDWRRNKRETGGANGDNPFIVSP